MSIRTFIRLIQVLNILFLAGACILIISPLFSEEGAPGTSLSEELILWALITLLLLRYALIWLPVKKSRYPIQFQSLLQKMRVALPFELSILTKATDQPAPAMPATTAFLQDFRLPTAIRTRKPWKITRRPYSGMIRMQFTETGLVLPSTTLTWKDLQDWRYKRATPIAPARIFLSGLDDDDNDYHQELAVDGLEASPLDLLLLLSWFKTQHG